MVVIAVCVLRTNCTGYPSIQSTEQFASPICSHVSSGVPVTFTYSVSALGRNHLVLQLVPRSAVSRMSEWRFLG